MTEERVERFVSWGGRIIGAIGIVIAAVVAVLGVFGSGGSYHPAAYPICGLAALLCWMILIRPSVAVTGNRLVLRNPVSTVQVPLAAIEQVVIRQWLVVRAGDRSFTNSGIGRSHRVGLRDDQRGDLSGQALAGLSYAALAERRIDRLAEEARAVQGVERYSDEQQTLAAGVRREWAWPEIGLLAALVVVLAVTLVL